MHVLPQLDATARVYTRIVAAHCGIYGKSVSSCRVRVPRFRDLDTMRRARTRVLDSRASAWTQLRFLEEAICRTRFSGVRLMRHDARWGGGGRG